MYRLPNQFHTPASQSQSAAGGGCTSSCCCCCVITSIGSSILSAIYFSKIPPLVPVATRSRTPAIDQTLPAPDSIIRTEAVDERTPSHATITPHLTEATTPAEPHLLTTEAIAPETTTVTSTTSAIEDNVTLRSILGLLALPITFFFGWLAYQLGQDLILPLIAMPLCFIGLFAWAYSLAKSEPLRGAGVGILWLIGLALATALEIFIWNAH